MYLNMAKVSLLVEQWTSSSTEKVYHLLTSSCGSTLILKKGFLLCFCRWPWCSTYIQVVNTTTTNTTYDTVQLRLHWFKMKMGSAVSCSFLSGALKQLYIHTLASIGPTQARLDATLESRCGDCQWKRKCHYSHTTVSAAFPILCKWFSKVLRDMYKKVSDTTVCISSKSFEKPLLVIWCSHWEYEVGCFLPFCSLLRFFGQHVDKYAWRTIAD